MNERNYKDLYKGNKLLLFICVVIGALIVARDVGGIYINKYILLFACVGTMPFLGYSNFLCLLGFLFALTFGIPSTYIYLVAAVVLAIKVRWLRRIQLIPFAFFVIAELILSVVYSSSTGIVSYVGYFSRLFIFFVLINDKKTNVDYKKILRYFVVGILIFIVAVLAIYLKDNTLQDIFAGIVRIGNTSEYLHAESISEGMKMSTNTNYVAYFCVVGVACCYTLYQFSEKKIIWAAMLFSIFIMGSTTVSKTYFGISAIIFLVILNGTLFGKLSVIKKVFFSAVIIAGVIALLNMGTVDALLNRFSKVDYIFQDSRTIIFTEYMNAIFEKPLALIFGTGVFTHREVLFAGQSTHNALQQVLVSYGVVGFVVFFVTLYKAVAIKFRGISMRWANNSARYCPFLVALLFTQTIQLLQPCDLMLPYIIGVFAIRVFDN